MSSEKILSRRQFLKKAGAGIACASLSPLINPITNPAQIQSFPFLRNPKLSKRVIVLGMDGLDPDLLQRFIAEGVMPNFKRFIEANHFSKLKTTMPAQSPVAWSSFTSGTNPGKHGIFDFIHRDPKTFTPHLSISRSHEGSRSLSIGKWRVPLESGRVELMRRGPAIWSLLEKHDIPATVFQIPSNFPVTPEATHAISGMGTPDLLGGYGTCSYFSDSDFPGSDAFDSSTIKKVRLIDNLIRASILGPKNSLREGSPDSEIEFTVRRDPWEPMVRIKIQDQDLVLKQGEWSEWVPLSFELMPLFATVPGMVRFYLKEAYPRFKLYVTPVNIDPMDPAMPIASPAGYSREISQIVGRFYTQGLPADTKSLATGILTDDEYFSQAKLVLSENEKMLSYQLENFREGMMFFYFSSIDQNCHMLMRNMDPTHPLYNPNASPEIKNAVRYLYQRMDRALGETLTKVDSSTTLMVLSDHGFGTFRREFHLNTWLMEQGYTVLKQPLGDDPGDVFSLVDWEKTRAYGLGFNGLYLNMKDREPRGQVAPDQAAVLIREICEKLELVVDPLNGQRVVSRAFPAASIYQGAFMGLAPDILVGYQRGYRTSDSSVLGKFPRATIGNRTDKWSSDHCFDSALVPGVFLTNARCLSADPAIWDLAPSILGAFGIETPTEMDGKNILERV